jgi:ketosteroid isomerase-like protein
MASIQVEIRGRLDAQTEAMRAKDIDRLMSLYSRDIVYFDVVPPLALKTHDQLARIERANLR